MRVIRLSRSFLLFCTSHPKCGSFTHHSNNKYNFKHSLYEFNKGDPGWTNPRTLLLGPSVERILERGLLVFFKLRSLEAQEAVSTFYDKLQELSAVYLLPLMPFDALQLEFNFEGLFVPGLGTERYADCASALMEVLPRLLPLTYTEVQAKLSSVCVESKNGYNLLW